MKCLALGWSGALRAFLKKRGFHVSLLKKPDPLAGRFGTDDLQRLNFQIVTLVDVGVFRGSPAFYDAFPDAKLVLIDPIPNLAQLVASWRERRPNDIIEINAGAGSEDAVAPLYVSNACTSFLVREDGLGRTSDVVNARIAPLDTLLHEVGAKGPFGLKIDSEGFEIDVIRGAAATLKRCEFVFAEVSLTSRFADGYRTSELIAELSLHGFEMAKVIPQSKHDRHFDGLFLPTARSAKTSAIPRTVPASPERGH